MESLFTKFVYFLCYFYVHIEMRLIFYFNLLYISIYFVFTPRGERSVLYRTCQTRLACVVEDNNNVVRLYKTIIPTLTNLDPYRCPYQMRPSNASSCPEQSLSLSIPVPQFIKIFKKCNRGNCWKKNKLVI